MIQTEAKHVQTGNIDNLLNENGTDMGEIQTTSVGDGNVFNQIFEGGQQEFKKAPSQPKPSKVNAKKWENDEEEESDDEEIQKIANSSDQRSFANQSLTIPSEDLVYSRLTNSSLPGVQLALGNLRQTISYLKSQLGITSRHEDLKPIMKDIYMMSYSQIKFIPCIPANELKLRQTINGKVFPQNGVSLDFLQETLNVKMKN